MGQQRVLLGPVEAVDLVQEEHGSPLVDPLTGCGKHLSNVFDPRRGCREGLEDGIGVNGDQPGQGGLPGSRRTPQQHRDRPAGFDDAPESRFRAEQSGEADHLVEVAGTHLGCQRGDP